MVSSNSNKVSAFVLVALACSLPATAPTDQTEPTAVNLPNGAAAADDSAAWPNENPVFTKWIQHLTRACQAYVVGPSQVIAGDELLASPRHPG